MKYTPEAILISMRKDLLCTDQAKQYGYIDFFDKKWDDRTHPSISKDRTLSTTFLFKDKKIEPFRVSSLGVVLNHKHRTEVKAITNIDLCAVNNESFDSAKNIHQSENNIFKVISRMQMLDPEPDPNVIYPEPMELIRSSDKTIKTAINALHYFYHKNDTHHNETLYRLDDIKNVEALFANLSNTEFLRTEPTNISKQIKPFIQLSHEKKLPIIIYDRNGKLKDKDGNTDCRFIKCESLDDKYIMLYENLLNAFHKKIFMNSEDKALCRALKTEYNRYKEQRDLRNPDRKTDLQQQPLVSQPKKSLGQRLSSCLGSLKCCGKKQTNDAPVIQSTDEFIFEETKKKNKRVLTNTFENNRYDLFEINEPYSSPYQKDKKINSELLKPYNNQKTVAIQL